MTIINSPTYTGVDGQQYEYEPPATLCSLRRYNIAQCARQRMQNAHANGYFAGDNYEQWTELWKRERISFWSTLQRSIPRNFRVRR